jgi:hypothetical protein
MQRIDHAEKRKTTELNLQTVESRGYDWSSGALLKNLIFIKLVYIPGVHLEVGRLEKVVDLRPKGRNPGLGCSWGTTAHKIHLDELRATVHDLTNVGELDLRFVNLVHQTLQPVIASLDLSMTSTTIAAAD